MTTIRASDAYLDSDYANKRKIKRMVDAIYAFGNDQKALNVFRDIKQSGMTNADPPVMWLLVDVGYFDDKSILDDAIAFLENK